MPKTLLIEELHLSFRVPRRQSTREGASIRRTLRTAKFERRLRRAVEEVLLEFSTLHTVKLAVSR